MSANQLPTQVRAVLARAMGYEDEQTLYYWGALGASQRFDATCAALAELWPQAVAAPLRAGEIVLIGGPSDGMRYPVGDREAVVAVPDPDSAHAGPRRPGQSFRDVAHTRTIYRIERMRCDEHVVRYGIPGDALASSCLQLLFEGYRRQKP